MPMELIRMRSFWIRVGPKSNMTGVLIRGDTEGKGHGMTEAGTAVTPLHAKDTGSHQKLGRGEKGCSPRSLGRRVAVMTP